jgi:hypothetical protein
LSAQLSGLARLEKIPKYSLSEEAVNDESTASLYVASTPDYKIIDESVFSKDPNRIQAVLKAHGHLPIDRTGGAFGYGIITAMVLDVAMFSTTHKGVVDGVKQTNKNDTV